MPMKKKELDLHKKWNSSQDTFYGDEKIPS